MPNWVDNTLTVKGTAEQVKAVKEQLTKSYETLRDPNEFGLEEKNLPFVRETVEVTGISFMNIISPSDIASYYGMYRNIDGTPKDNKEANSTSLAKTYEVLMGLHKPDFAGQEVAIGSDWYSWNNANWGCKWDASNAYVENDEPEEYSVSFSTPWAPPTQVITTLSSQHPEVTFTLRYEEEQGWGGEDQFLDGEVEELDSWDIPNSHADYQKLERECVCEWSDDQEDWFSDCPKEKVEA